MAQLVRTHGAVLIALGAGVVVGSGIVYIYQRLTVRSVNISQSLAELATKVDQLRQEVQSLRAIVDQQMPQKSKFQDYYSVHASSGDEDELYEDPYDGSEHELRKVDSFSSGDEYVQASNGGLQSPSSFSQLCSHVDKLLDGSEIEYEEAYNVLRENEKKYLRNSNYLWRLAKASYLVAKSREDVEDKKKLVYESKDKATRALEIDDNNPNIHKWYAITLGSIGDYEGTQVKIQNGYKFKEHVEKAVELNPKDPSSHYLLGRWCFGVYMLSWVERQVAATLFASPPSSTVDEALQHFLEAHKLNSQDWKENLLYIAKCMIEKKDYRSAAEWLDKADKVATLTQDDRVCQTEIESLLQTYKWYRD